MLLDSAAAGPLGRYSILAAYPQAALWQDSEGMLQRSGGGARRGAAAGLSRGSGAALEPGVAIAGPAPPGSGGRCPFRGGWFVYLGYEMAGGNRAEAGAAGAAAAQDAPRAFALRVPAALIYDHEAGQGLGRSSRPGHADLPLRLTMHSGALGSSRDAAAPQRSCHRRAASSRRRIPQRFGQRGPALEHIRAGDIYQANLSRGWRARIRARLAAAMHCSRRARGSTSDCARESGAVCGAGAIPGLASAELLARAAGARGGTAVETRPIAGTRPRSRGADADWRELAALIAHPKERAEHIMLVDLERNDLGRICRAGQRARR